MYFADLEQQIISISTKTALIGGGILLVTAVIAVLANKRLKKRQFNKLKLPLFGILLATALIGTSILIFNTVYLNVTSSSRGPVHWHTDIEFWACGSEVELRDPTGRLSNKIGTSTYHEHNDKRIHLEGVVVENRDASLGKFMEVTGGYLSRVGVAIPLNEDSNRWLEDQGDGDRQSTDFAATMGRYVGGSSKGPVLELRNDALACGFDRGEVQVFVYRFDKASDTYRQTKLTDPAAYVIRDEGIVPPGDCIIVEFDKPKKTTNKLCQQYGVRDTERCEEFGVKDSNPELCKIRQVESGGE